MMLPHVIEYHGVVIPTYGVLRLLAFAVALWLGVYLTGREGIRRGILTRFGLLTLLVGVTSPKLYLLLRGESLSHFLRAGGGIYCGLIPGILFALWYLKRHGLPVMKVLDGFSPSVALGLAIARIGCFAAGCCYGQPTDGPVGAVYENSSLTTGVPLDVQIHPTQLYEAALSLIVVAVLLGWRTRQRFDSQTFSVMLILCGASRFLVEIVRGDPGRGFIVEGWLSVPQLISLLLILAASGWMLRLAHSGHRSRKKTRNSNRRWVS